MSTLEKHLIQIWAEIAEMKKRQANMVRHGPVKEVDAKKQLCRIQLNPDNGKEPPFLSAWVPYAQVAGDYKFHNPVSVGQNVTVFAPGGELSQAVAVPFTWSDTFKSPSDKQDEHVVAFGNSKIIVKKDEIVLSVGGSTLTITAGKITAKSARIETDGKTYLGKPDAEKKAIMEGLLECDDVFLKPPGRMDVKAKEIEDKAEAAAAAAAAAAGNGSS